MSKRFAVTISLLAFAGAGLRADFSYQETTKITGGSMTRMMRMVPGGGKSMEPRTSFIYLRGNRMARLGPDRGNIIDLDKETITDINFEKKTYSVLTFDEMRQITQAMQSRMAEARQEQGSNQAQMSMKVDVKQTGQTRTISGLNARGFLLTVTVEMQSSQDGQPATGNLTDLENELWMVPDVPGYKEIAEFQMRMAKKMTWSADMNPMMMQMRNSGSATAKMTEEMSKLKGTPLLTVTRMKGMGGMMGGGGAPASSGGTTPSERSAADDQLARPSISGAAGGMLGSMIRRKQQQQQQQQQQPQAGGAPAAQGGESMLMETTSEKANFSTASVDVSKLDVPGGFKQVESDMKKANENMNKRKSR